MGARVEGNTRMKLLIITQVVDTEDPILGFFVRWIEEFAKHNERIEVICLKEGAHALPGNVRVHSLGKERGTARRIVYARRFLSLVWRLRGDYDAVFVHMNPEYVVLGGLFWRLRDKRTALWYTHKSVDTKLRVATFLSSIVFTASKESFRLPSKKVRVMGHGIDTNFFSLEPAMTRTTAVLSAGRLSPTKRHDLVIRAAEHFPNEVWIVGEGPEKLNLEQLAESLSLTGRVRFLGPQTQEGLREKYRAAGVFVHASETGSLDKVVLEALACGLPVITTSVALTGLPVTTVPAASGAIAREVMATRPADTRSLAAFVREYHSLQRLIPAIMDVMQTA